MHPDRPDSYPRRILLAVTGLSPQIVTETLYALAVKQTPAFVPTEIHLITTGKGAEHARLNLLSDAIGWFQRLRRDWDLPTIAFTPQHIHTIPGSNGAPLEDIRDGSDNTRAADYITARVAELTRDSQAVLHVSIAGGRKTMGYYLGYALSLFGREQDRLSHVLVSAPYENHREFYYPTPYEHAIHVNEGGKEIAYDCRYARIELADIPFVRLRQGLPQELLDGEARFSAAVAAAHCAAPQPELRLDVSAQQVHAGGERVRLTPKEFALLLWLAQRRWEGRGPITCTKVVSKENAAEYLATCRIAFGEHSAETERLEKGLRLGMDSTWFSPAKTRINTALIQALGRSNAAPYQIRNIGKRCEGRFDIALEPRNISIHHGAQS